MSNRTFILISCPDNFAGKFSAFINNINAVNNESTEPKILIEKVYIKKRPEYAAVPIDKDNVDETDNKIQKGDLSG